MLRYDTNTRTHYTRRTGHMYLILFSTILVYRITAVRCFYTPAFSGGVLVLLCLFVCLFVCLSVRTNSAQTYGPILMKLKTQVDPYDETILTKNEINIFIRKNVIQLTKFESTVHASTVPIEGRHFVFFKVHRHNIVPPRDHTLW
jgi:hypothetical protein